MRWDGMRGEERRGEEMNRMKKQELGRKCLNETAGLVGELVS